MIEWPVCWRWIKDHAVWLFGVTAAVLGAGWLWRLEHGRRQSVLAQLEVERTRRRIAALQERRDGHMERAADLSTRIVEIDRQIDESKKRAGRARAAVQGRSADEVADRFNRMYRAR